MPPARLAPIAPHPEAIPHSDPTAQPIATPRPHATPPLDDGPYRDATPQPDLSSHLHVAPQADTVPLRTIVPFRNVAARGDTTAHSETKAHGDTTHHRDIKADGDTTHQRDTAATHRDTAPHPTLSSQPRRGVISSRQAVGRPADRPAPGGTASRATVALVAIGAALAFTLSGCSRDRPTTPAPAATPAQSAAAARTEDGLSPVRPKETHAYGSGDAGLDRFVAAVQQQLPEVALDRRDEEIEALGEQACENLAAGKEALAGEGLTGDQAGKLVTLARATVCRP